jgi:Flp pilus assembly protein TadG
LVRDGSGATAVITGFAITVIIGFEGLGVDVANWEVTRCSVQGAADQAAYSAVVANEAGGGARR